MNWMALGFSLLLFYPSSYFSKMKFCEKTDTYLFSSTRGTSGAHDWISFVKGPCWQRLTALWTQLSYTLLLRWWCCLPCLLQTDKALRADATYSFPLWPVYPVWGWGKCILSPNKFGWIMASKAPCIAVCPAPRPSVLCKSETDSYL